ncbi:MAG: Glu/Leu/Phe/Val dehydrogenase dimerization domain-containing protein [Chloroflexota bacterium]
MSVFSHPEFDHHEQVIYCHDASVDLFGIIAIHNSHLGPAAGGCRMYPYASADEALTDVLRLSKGMSYKNAMAGLPLGGGKCVIIADPARADKAALLRAFSHHVQALNGRYWTAIDIGVTPKDADILAENCDYIFARASQYPDGFDPSAFTALGCFTGIRAATKHVWNRTDLKGLRVAIQGLGATGHALAHQLHEAGSQLVVADIRDEVVQQVVDRYGAIPVEVNRIHTQTVDIFAPCAMGAVINDETLSEIKATVICGVANNQLAEPRHGEALQQRGITYVPDYVVNAGGIMGAGAMIYSTPTIEESQQRALGLYDTILAILEKAANENRPSSEVADEMAREHIAAGRK